MSKYNNGSSIPIENLSASELRESIKEWSEGNKALEQLLWTCLDNGVETHGSHVGPNSYLDIIVNDSYDKVRNMIYSVQDIDGFRLMCTPDGGNPFSSKYFYKASISFGFFDFENEEDISKVFERINLSFNYTEQKESTFDVMLDLYKFFEEKESNLVFCMEYDSGKYKLRFDLYGLYNREYFLNLFEKCGIDILDVSSCGNPNLFSWSFEEKSANEFVCKTREFYQLIVKNYSLDLPNIITNDMTFETIARIKRRYFGDSPSGVKKFDEWLKKEKEIRNKKINNL